jgi:hypothetical protein
MVRTTAVFCSCFFTTLAAEMQDEIRGHLPRVVECLKDEDRPVCEKAINVVATLADRGG